MASSLKERLQATIDRETIALQAINDDEAAIRSGGADTWSPKDELGHLIDSATNNHVRFVRGAIEFPFSGPGYQQNEWVRLHGYNQLPWTTLVDFWSRYNLFLAHLIGQIPADRLENECRVGSGAPVTLRMLIEDYILHMQHHLDHVLRRPVITQYPAVKPGA